MEQNEVKEPESKFLKRVIPHQGHKCFEYNYVENELRYATMAGDNTKRVDIRKDCVYITALNYKNAVKHFRKMFQVEFTPVIVK